MVEEKNMETKPMETKKDTKKESPKETIEFKADPKVWKTLSFAHMTEKSINLIEKENKLAFIVNLKSNKQQVKDAFEKAFDVKIDKVNILIDQKGRKKAFVKLNKDYAAADVAMQLGIM